MLEKVLVLICLSFFILNTFAVAVESLPVEDIDPESAGYLDAKINEGIQRVQDERDKFFVELDMRMGEFQSFFNPFYFFAPIIVAMFLMCLILWRKLSVLEKELKELVVLLLPKEKKPKEKKEKKGDQK